MLESKSVGINETTTGFHSCHIDQNTAVCDTQEDEQGLILILH